MKKFRKAWAALCAVLAMGTMVTATSCDALGNVEDLLGNLGGIFQSGSSDTVETSDSLHGETSNEELEDETTDEKPDGEQPEEKYEVITIAEALEICDSLATGEKTEERYYIRGTVDTILNPQYGEMMVSDGTGSIKVYGTYSADGEIRYGEMESKPYKGDEVVLSCILQNYNDSKEVYSGWIIEFVSKQPDLDLGEYTEMSIEDARDAEEGDKVLVEGVVAQITYANGKVPNGVMLVDDTQSIYVYDGNLAGRVTVGNKISIAASKTYWILEKEQSAAAQHGYKGCNQLENVTLLTNDEGNNEYNKEWIEKTTVKSIVETPVTEDVTTIVYEVTALVKEVPGNGFTNYYFYDLDGETGAYTYTQCNGGDFDWVRAYDGKICTVYLTALNAKSSGTACFFRLLPIEIIDEGFTFDVEDAAQFAVEYYGVGQFEASYGADPELELLSSVSSSLLGFEGATLSYASDNTASVYFETVEGKTVMHCNENGKANVTVTGEYNGKIFSKSVVVEVQAADSYDALTVAQAISAAVDSEVTVKGIVGPSVVNKDGFYLFGEDGSVIAVLVKDTAQFKGLAIGHQIVLTGMRERYVKNDASTIAGQTCIVNAEIIANAYGKHEYSTEKFVTENTLADFRALDNTVDYSTTVFVVTATLKLEGSAHYSNYKLTDGGTIVSIYMSGAGQYSFMKEFENKTITVEIAACNWNEKGYWAACVLAVYTDEGKILNTLNFDSYA